MTDATKVWMPDTFFRNEKIGRFHNILQSNLYVRVFPNGDVLYSIRVSLTCACSMHLALFPLDKQTCNLDVASCEYYLCERVLMGYNLLPWFYLPKLAALDVQIMVIFVSCLRGPLKVIVVRALVF